MASVILVVGFMGMISALTVGYELNATGQRATLANQIAQHEIEQLRLADWSTIDALPSAATTLYGPWANSTAYGIGDTVTHSGSWYRCVSANTGQAPTNVASWKQDIPPYATLMSTSGTAIGTTYSISRTATDVTTGMIEISITVSWTKSGTTSAATTATGSWLQRLSFSGNAPISRTYTRTAVTYITRNGLNQSYQRS